MINLPSACVLLCRFEGVIALATATKSLWQRVDGTAKREFTVVGIRDCEILAGVK